MADRPTFYSPTERILEIDVYYTAELAKYSMALFTNFKVSTFLAPASWLSTEEWMSYKISDFLEDLAVENGRIVKQRNWQRYVKGIESLPFKSDPV